MTSLNAITEKIKKSQQIAEEGLAAGANTSKPTPVAGARAAQQIDRLRAALDQWYGFYNGYDPLFTAKAPEPIARWRTALNDYARLLREKVAGLKPGSTLPVAGGGGPDGSVRGGRGGGGAPTTGE